MRRCRSFVLIALVTTGLAACAGPPLTLYTLSEGGTPGTLPALDSQPLVLAVPRVAIPDALDSTDILLRDGAVLRRSATSRWASRLSIGLTDFLTAHLAARLPNALVTDQAQAGPISARLMIDISQFDMSIDGQSTLTANWTVIPADAARPIRRGRAQLAAQGPVTSDRDVVALTRVLASRLAAAIDLSELR